MGFEGAAAPSSGGLGELETLYGSFSSYLVSNGLHEMLLWHLMKDTSPRKPDQAIAFYGKESLQITFCN